MVGLNKIEFFRDGHFDVSSLIAQKKIDNFGKKENELRGLQQMSQEAIRVLQQNRNPVTELGALIDEAWHLKRQLADGVTTPAIDQIYAAGCEAGALEGKLLGAGGGGFMLFIVKPED